VADEEGELAGDVSKHAWSSPPEPQAPAAPLAAAAFPSALGPPASEGAVAPAIPTASLAPVGGTPPSPGVAGFEPQSPDFAAIASRMGREVARVSPVFRVAAVLILVGALILVVENAMIFTSTVSMAATAPQIFDSPANNTSAQGTGQILASTEGYFATLATATKLDIVGFSALGIGAILVGLGSRGIVFRMRFDGEEKRPSKAVLILGLLSGAFALLWVVLTMTWRTELTGLSTGDWAFAPGMFDFEAWASARQIPPNVENFVNSFPAASTNWILAAIMQVPAAAFFFATGWAIKRDTGIKVGGLSWVVFSVIALIGVVVFVTAVIGALMTVGGMDFADPSSLGEAIPSIAIQLGVAAVTKLLFIPFWGMLSFLILSIAGFKLMRIRPGKVLMGDKDVRAIVKTPSAAAFPAAAAPPAAGAPPTGPMGSLSRVPPMAATETSLRAPPSGDVVVTLSGPPSPPPRP